MHLSKLGYYADFFISLALIGLMVGFAMMKSTWLMLGGWALCALVGVAGWTIIEYLVHRWLYHHVPFFREVHAAHHAEPDAHIGAPPIGGIVLIFTIFFVPLVGISPIAASGLTTGVLIGYVSYMLVHHAAHYWSMSPGSWLYRASRHHSLHHYQSQTHNFGITTSTWDHAFGTAVTSGRGHDKTQLAAG